MTPQNVRKLHLVQLSAAVDVAAQLLARNIFAWKSPRYERNVPSHERRKLLGRLVQKLLAQVILDMSLRSILAEEKNLDQRLAALDVGRNVPDMPEPARRLNELAIRRALPHLERAVIGRVIQQRDDAGPEAPKVGAWLGDFRKACLCTEPRLIPPAMSVRTFGQELERLRAKAGLLKLSKTNVRRSHRSIGLARLRSWGLVADGG